MPQFESREAFISDGGLTEVEKNSLDNKDCPICLSEYGATEPDQSGPITKNENEEAKVYEDPVKLPCNHVFGSRCILTWTETSDTCPLCRTSLYGDPTIQEYFVYMDALQRRGYIMPNSLMADIYRVTALLNETIGTLAQPLGLELMLRLYVFPLFQEIEVTGNRARGVDFGTLGLVFAPGESDGDNNSEAHRQVHDAQVNDIGNIGGVSLPSPDVTAIQEATLETLELVAGIRFDEFVARIHPDPQMAGENDQMAPENEQIDQMDADVE